MGARVYDPYTGTFTQPDPVQGGGANAYGYTNGDPVNETDLDGDTAGRLAPDFVQWSCAHGRGCAVSPSDLVQVASFFIPGLGEEEAGADALISMDRALDLATDHAGPDAVMETTGKGTNYQFRGTSTDADGNTVQQIGRLDVNADDPGVAARGPHLNLETHINGEQIRNDHIPIDPHTIRPGDHP